MNCFQPLTEAPFTMTTAVMKCSRCFCCTSVSIEKKNNIDCNNVVIIQHFSLTTQILKTNQLFKSICQNLLKLWTLPSFNWTLRCLILCVIN